jgi:hypothetical protein
MQTALPRRSYDHRIREARDPDLFPEWPVALAPSTGIHVSPSVEVGDFARGAARHRLEIAHRVAERGRNDDAGFIGNLEVLVKLVFEHLVHGSQRRAKSLSLAALRVAWL